MPKFPRLALPTFVVCSAAWLGGCAAPFSEMQGARLTGPQRVDLTPMASQVQWSDRDGTENVQRHFGAHLATGVAERVDMRLRVEHIRTQADDGDDGVNTTVVAVGPKVSVLKDRVALFVPVGTAFGGGVESGEAVQVHPTLLFTVPLGSRVDLNPSVKALVPIGADDGETLVAANLGLGIRLGQGPWMLVPEVGVLRNPGESGAFRHFTIGLNRRFERR